MPVDADAPPASAAQGGQLDPTDTDPVSRQWEQFQQLTQVTNHWDRPGWTPQRSSYHWLLTLGHDHRLRALAERCQEGLSALPNLDFVPLDNLHVTVDRLAFTDEVSPHGIGGVVQAAEDRCRNLEPFSLTIGPLSGSAGAVRFTASPHQPVRRLRDELRISQGDVAGPENPKEPSRPFMPHVSIAYHNAASSAGPVVEQVRGLRALGAVRVNIERVDLVHMRRRDHSYVWSVLRQISFDG